MGNDYKGNFNPIMKFFTTVLYLCFLGPTIYWAYPVIKISYNREQAIMVSAAVLVATLFYYFISYKISQLLFGKKP